MKENITLYELLTNLDNAIKFKLSEKLKIYVIISTSGESSIVKTEEYYLSEVPLRLLRNRVVNVDYDDNWIEVLKW